MSSRGFRFTLACVVLSAVLPGRVAAAQVPATTSAPAARPAQPSPEPAPPKDALGRDTPRGAVLGFMKAAGDVDVRDEVTPQYLNTKLRDQAAIDLAHKLFVVLDRRLPPHLGELSDRPEGSLANPLKPDQDVVGTIATDGGPLDIVVERVNVRGQGSVWLFSRKTLEAIPDVYDDVDLVTIDRLMPKFLTTVRVAGIRLFTWLMLVLVVPIFYRLLGLPGRLLGPVLGKWRHRHGYLGELPAHLLPGSVRLLLMAGAIRWVVRLIEIPLLERVFWSGIATFLLIGGMVWALLQANGAVERRISRRFRGAGRGEIIAMLRLARRLADVLVIAAGVLVTLHHFGVDATAALAGLGIGGIAVALAAQKTLENVVGGVSIIFDQAVRVGDFLKLGETCGTVDYIGLRSTRIRTLDRTVLSVPNGQIANANIETLSARDKFWFHHFVGLRYETTASQMRVVVNDIRTYLGSHPMVDPSEPIRVRFFRFGRFSLDIEVFAYLIAGNWDAFLETQQELLLEVMDIIERSGAVIALPSQTLHLAQGREVASDIRPDRRAAIGPTRDLSPDGDLGMGRSLEYGAMHRTR